MLSALFALLFTSPALLSLPLPLLSLRNIGMKAFGPAVLAPPVPGPVEVGSRLHVAPAPHEEAAAVRRTCERVYGDVLRARVNGKSYNVLSGLSPLTEAESDPAGRGVFLSFGGAPERSEHTFELGALSCSRLLAGARIKRWWMGPVFGNDASALPPETQFVLVELDGSAEAYAVVQPLVSGPSRCTLRGDAKGRLLAQVQSGNSDVRTTGMDAACFVATGDDPFELLSRSFRAVADRLGSFEVASRKRPPADLDLFGWCTWDAFYQAVDPAGIFKGLRSLRDAGTPPRMMIIDDGWQTVVQDHADDLGTEHAPVEAMVSEEMTNEEARALNKPQDAEAPNPLVSWVYDFYRDRVDGADVDATPVRVWRACANSVLKGKLKRFFAEETEFSKRLGAFSANAKFEDEAAGKSLKGMLTQMRAEFGGMKVYAWHALSGYWGGISVEAEAMAHLEPVEAKPKPTRSLLEVEPALGWDAAALHGCGIAPGRELQLFHGMHAYLAEAGIDGVKIDAQSGTGPFGGVNQVRESVRAMESSVGDHFEGNRCVNCMCHSTENLYNYKSTALLRAADDFYPAEDGAQPVHLAHVAYNSLFLSEIGTPDWDMFTSAHKDAGMHAAARAISGGPLYVSDAPGKHNGELLSRLVLPDGTQLRCTGAGRPTRDVLFTDPNVDGETALKIWNRNAVGGVLAAFNVQGSRWDMGVRQFVQAEDGAKVVRCALRAEDVEGLFPRADPGVVVPVEQRPGGAPLRPAAAADPASVLFGHQSQQLVPLARGAAHSVELADREWEMFAVVPVQHSGRARWAPIGLTRMLNAGGAVVESSLSAPFGRAPQARVTLRASDTFGAYCQPRPRTVKVAGADGEVEVDFAHDAATGLLTVDLPREAAEVRLSVEFATMVTLKEPLTGLRKLSSALTRPGLLG